MTFEEAATLSSSIPPAQRVKAHGAPALTILWHPDFSRLGATASLAELSAGQPVPLSRISPTFRLGRRPADCLSDPYLSRNPYLQIVRSAKGVELVPGEMSTKVQLDGQPLSGKMTLTGADLIRSPILTLARRVVLCLHHAMPTGSADTLDDLGMIGLSGEIDAVRQAIVSAAGIDLPVLIRGETGTGKELTAKAIAKASTRAQKSFVAINMGALPPNTAVAELFGHARGAFTGATESRDGHFVEADGGILLLDEVGLASPDVQTALLRVLETGEVRPLGARSPRRVNVRVLAATDARLEERVRTGQFSEALFHRLSAFTIALPSLRERRQDIGLLFLHFLRSILKETGDLSRLEAAPDAKQPWIPADLMTSVALAPWPGNVRQLRNFAVQLALANRGASQAVLNPALQALLSQEERAPAPSAPPATTPKPRAKPTDTSTITHEMLVDALERNGFRPTRAARDLGISRTTFYELVRRDPELRKAADIPDSELHRLQKEHGDDLAGISRRLHVSVRALQLRLRRSRSSG
jgi:two-component system nitrogen regulation response regulator GlnG